MSTIAELKLIVDASQLEQAKRALDEFNNAASKVDTGSISKAIGEYSKEADALVAKTQEVKSKTEELTNTLKEGANSVVTMGDSFNKAASSVAPLAANMDKLKESQKESLAIEKEVIRSQQQADAQRLKLISGLQEELALFGKSKHEIALYRAEQLGVLDTVAPLVRELEALAEAKRKEAEAGKSSGSKSKADKQQELDMAKEEVRLLNESADAVRNRTNVQNQLDEAERRQSEARNNSLKRDIESQELKNITQASKELREERQKEALATKQVADEFQKLRVQIDPVKGAYEKLYAQLAKLEELKKKSKGNANLIDPNEVKELETAINRNITQLDKLGATTGKTAKEMAFAMRGLPAQFTDVVVSLQGGQKPLTVLLQQGGQVKDMFGGIVPAFKAMGEYALSLITPLNLVIAGIGLLAYTTYSGSQEIDNFRKSLILTGNSSKVTTKELADGAKQVATSYGTVGKASEVINQVATTTKVAKENIVAVTEATMRWSDETGVAVSDILSEFGKLSSESGIEELQGKYAFLNEEVRRSADIARESGGAAAERAVLEKALADTLAETAERSRASLTGLSLAYNVLTEAVAKGYDKLKDGGRAFSDTADEADFLKDKIKNLEENSSALSAVVDNMPDSFYRVVPALAGLKLALGLVSDEADLTRQALDNLDNSVKNKKYKEYTDSISGLSSAFESVIDPTLKLENRLKEVNKWIENINTSEHGSASDLNKALQVKYKLESDLYDLRKKNPATAAVESAKDALLVAEQQYGASEKLLSSQITLNNKKKEYAELEAKVAAGSATSAEIELLHTRDQVIAEYEKAVVLEKGFKARQEAERQSKKSSVVSESAADRMLSSMKQQEASLIAQRESTTQMGSEQRKQVELIERFRLIEEKSLTVKLSKEEASLLANKDALLTQQEKVVAAEKELRLKNDTLKVDQLRAGLDATLKAERTGFEQQKDLVGFSDKEKERVKERNKLEQEYAKAIDDAAKAQVGNSALSEEAYARQLDDIKAFYDERKGLLEEYYEFEKEQADNWQAGFAEGLANFVDNQVTMFDIIKETTEETLASVQEGIAQNLTQAIMYGDDLRESFHQLKLTILEGVLKSLIQLGLQYGINAAKEVLGITTVAAAKKTAIVSTAAVANTAATTSAGVQAGAAATTASSWSLAAIMASIGSFGSAAAIGVAAIVAALAFSKGFKSGGYTGNGGTSEVAGVVHGKEFVFDAASTSRIGINNLENIRRGGSYSQGSVGSISNNNSRSTNVTQVFNVTGEVDNRTSAQMAMDASASLSLAQRFA